MRLGRRRWAICCGRGGPRPVGARAGAAGHVGQGQGFARNPAQPAPWRLAPSSRSALRRGCAKTMCRNGNQQLRCHSRRLFEALLLRAATRRPHSSRRAPATAFSHSPRPKRTPLENSAAARGHWPPRRSSATIVELGGDTDVWPVAGRRAVTWKCAAPRRPAQLGGSPAGDEAVVGRSRVGLAAEGRGSAAAVTRTAPTCRRPRRAPCR
jgi:hypothetical protein